MSKKEIQQKIRSVCNHYGDGEVLTEQQFWEIEKLFLKERQQIISILEGMISTHKYCDATVHDRSCKNEEIYDKAIKEAISKIKKL